MTSIGCKVLGVSGAALTQKSADPARGWGLLGELRLLEGTLSANWEVFI